jgi:hypothetical protein
MMRTVKPSDTIHRMNSEEQGVKPTHSVLPTRDSAEWAEWGVTPTLLIPLKNPGFWKVGGTKGVRYFFRSRDAHNFPVTHILAGDFAGQPSNQQDRLGVTPTHFTFSQPALPHAEPGGLRKQPGLLHSGFAA